MKLSLAILLLCAACSSGGHAKRPSYPGYVLDTVFVTDGIASHYQWQPESGKTVFQYWLGEPRTDGESVMEIGPDL